jgi:hypothetical protein
MAFFGQNYRTLRIDEVGCLDSTAMAAYQLAKSHALAEGRLIDVPILMSAILKIWKTESRPTDILSLDRANLELILKALEHFPTGPVCTVEGLGILRLNMSAAGAVRHALAWRARLKGTKVTLENLLLGLLEGECPVSREIFECVPAIRLLTIQMKEQKEKCRGKFDPSNRLQRMSPEELEWVILGGNKWKLLLLSTAESIFNLLFALHRIRSRFWRYAMNILPGIVGGILGAVIHQLRFGTAGWRDVLDGATIGYLIVPGISCLFAFLVCVLLLIFGRVPGASQGRFEF